MRRIRWNRNGSSARWPVPLLLVLAGLLAFPMILDGPFGAGGQEGRKHVAFPDIPGYETLRADFHMHTIFSDGQVLPGTRLTEAWREGLDVVSITDHDTMDPEHVVGDKNTPYRMARQAAKNLGLILINGTEITRFQDPDRVGHFNALFLEEVGDVVGKDYFQAIEAAVAQGGFVFLNHPSEGWNSHEWKEEFQRLEAHGYIHGVEVVNGGRYYDNAHDWCNGKGLTAVGTSDLHGPSHYSYGYGPEGHRPMTLLFVRERSADGVKEALFAGRTVVYSGNMLYGKEELLQPLFRESITIPDPEVALPAEGAVSLQIRNHSDVDLRLIPADGTDGGWQAVEGGRGIEASGAVVVPARRIGRLTLRSRDPGETGTLPLRLRYRVENLLTAPGSPLTVEIPLEVTVAAQ